MSETKTKLKAFHGDPELKAQKIQEMKEHMALDEILQGRYVQYQDGTYKGCAVACTLARPKNLEEVGADDFEYHEEYERQLGIPKSIAHLEDKIFEGLSVEESKTFPLEFLESISVGADLSDVSRKLMIWLLVDPENGVINFVPKDKSYSEQVTTSITNVAQLLENNVTDRGVLQKAASAAASAADASYWAASAAASYWAIRSSDYAAADATEAAAEATSKAIDDEISKQKYYLKIKTKFIELLKEAK